MTVVQHLGEKLEIKQAAPRFPRSAWPCTTLPSQAVLRHAVERHHTGGRRPDPARHALIAMQGPRAVGYLGWALFTIEEALAHVQNGEAPEAPRAIRATCCGQ